MIFIVMHVLVLLIVAWFVLFAASKAEGLVKLLGNLLAAVLLLVAIAGAVLMAAHGLGYKIPGFGRMMHVQHWDRGEQLQQEQQSAPAPTNP